MSEGALDLIASAITVYSLLIIASVIFSWVELAQPRLPQFIRQIKAFIDTLVDPYLDLFRRVLPPLAGFDLSPIVGLIVLQILGRLLIESLAF